MGYTNHQNTIQGLEGREKVQFEEKATRATRPIDCLSGNLLSRPPHRGRPEFGQAPGSEGVWLLRYLFG